MHYVYQLYIMHPTFTRVFSYGRNVRNIDSGSEHAQTRNYFFPKVMNPLLCAPPRLPAPDPPLTSYF